MKSQKNKRTIARHNTELSVEDLMNGSTAILKENGSLSIIFPALDFNENLKLAEVAGFGLVRCTLVSPYSGKKPNRVLTEFAKNFKGKSEKSTLILYKDTQQTRSAEYSNLAREFYLDW